MTGGFEGLKHAAGVLRKVAVGWFLIAGMVVYSLLLGCTQASKWVGARLQPSSPAEAEHRIPTPPESVDK